MYKNVTENTNITLLLVQKMVWSETCEGDVKLSGFVNSECKQKHILVYFYSH